MPVPDFARDGAFADLFEPVGPSKVERDVFVPFDCMPDDREINPQKCHLEDHSKERTEQIKEATALAFAPPFIVLVLGVAFAWVVRGFRQKA
jgi:hypothetical protein